MYTVRALPIVTDATAISTVAITMPIRGGTTDRVSRSVLVLATEAVQPTGMARALMLGMHTALTKGLTGKMRKTGRVMPIRAAGEMTHMLRGARTGTRPMIRVPI